MSDTPADDGLVDEEAMLVDMEGIGVWLDLTARCMAAMDGGDDTPEAILELPREVAPEELRAALLASANLALMAGLTAENVAHEAAVYVTVAQQKET